jgi:hypothetical protein
MKGLTMFFLTALWLFASSFVVSAAPIADQNLRRCNVRLSPASIGGPHEQTFIRKANVKSGTESVYMGRYGGIHYAFEGSGGNIRLVKLSEETVKQHNLHPGNRDFPAVPKQMNPTMCVPTVVSYLQEIELPKSAPLRAAPNAARALGMMGLSSQFFGWPGFFQNPANPAAGAAEVQDKAVRQTLIASGFQVQETDRVDDVVKAVTEGKIVYLGVVAGDDNQWVMKDDKANSYDVVKTLQPYYGGDRGHAMLAVDLLHDTEGKSVIVLIDVFSGLPVPTDIYYLQPSPDNDGQVAIQSAYIITKP